MYREIYLDNSATTRPYDEVIEYMNGTNRKIYGNPSSLHTKGIEAEKLVRKARESIAQSMNVTSKEIYFTSGGTESNNLAIRGYLSANPRKGKHIITTKIEHPAVLEVYKHLEGNGYTADYIGVDAKGVIDLEELKGKIREDTALISIILVNNEIGTIQPVEEVVKARNAANSAAAIHLDAVQAYGKLSFMPRKLGVEMVTVSSHKIHGPKGVGALYVNKNTRIKPIMFGGGQEAALRSGTENVPGICGFGLAADIIFKNIEQNNLKVQDLKSLLIRLLEDREIDFNVNSPQNSSPYVLNISFKNIRAEVLLHHLEERNIYVSTGSACSSRKNLHSHVLTALKLQACDIEGAVRFSFSALNSEQDILDTADAIEQILPRIQIRRGGKR
jgi:cysteine desulfurase